MSLFSIISEKNKTFIDPQKVSIEGDVNGIFFSGHIDAIFENSNSSIERLKVLIGNELNNKIGFHDLKLKIDDNPYKILIQQIDESEKTFKTMEKQGEQVIFGFGNEFYSTIYISNVLQKQKVTLSVDFELPISYIANNIVIFFPLSYTGSLEGETLKCNDFHLSVKSSFFELNEKSSTSNPEGYFDSDTSSYIIDHLEQSISDITITIDQNISKIDDNFFNIDQKSQISNENNIGLCSGKYGSIKFVPDKNEQEDYSKDEFIFIIDCSGSMSGKSIILARECLLLFIKSLPENCNFNVVRFGSYIDPFFKKPVLYSNSNVNEALIKAQNLDADLENTNLAKPLKFIFDHSPSKFRRVFVLTDGRVFDPEEVISLIKDNSESTICSAIGIGTGVDKKLVEQIGKEGNGFVDFVSSTNDDMKSAVINQLSMAMKGVCNVEISIENNELFETIPPLSNVSFIPGQPVTLYFKTPNEMEENTHVMIDVKGNEKQSIIELKNLSNDSRVQKSLEFMFNNGNLKYLRNMELTDETKSKIIQKSIEYGILSPFVGLIGIRELSSQEEKEKTIDIIKNLRTDEIEDEIYNSLNSSNIINVKTCTGKTLSFNFSQSHLIGDLKQSIYEKEGIPLGQINLVFAGKKLENNKSFKDYSVPNNATAHMVLRLRGDGGGYPGQYTGLNSIVKQVKTIKKVDKDVSNDLISIIAKQQIDGCWSEIPNELYNKKYKKMKDIIQNTTDLCKKINIADDKIICTLVCLIYMKKFMLEEFKTWELIYDKGMKWLSSFNQNINWNNVMTYLL